MEDAPTPRTLVFDVNETLLDMRPLRENVAAVLNGRPELVGTWFRTLLHYSLVHNSTDDYQPFGEIAVAALQLTAARQSIDLAESVARQALSALTRLPAHADVSAGLARLRDAGFRLVTLTNGSRQDQKDQLAYAGLTSYFTHTLSVESVGYFKPDPRVYDWALGELAADPADVLMVAAHPWDVLGARTAGWRTAFLGRPGTAWYLLATPPDYIVSTLTTLADKLIE